MCCVHKGKRIAVNPEIFRTHSIFVSWALLTFRTHELFVQSLTAADSLACFVPFACSLEPGPTLVDMVTTGFGTISTRVGPGSRLLSHGYYFRTEAAAYEIYENKMQL